MGPKQPEVTCVKPMTYNYESYAKVIHYMTTMVSHVNMNQS